MISLLHVCIFLLHLYRITEFKTTAVTNLTTQCPEFISTQILTFCQCLLPMQSILKHPNIILEIPSVIF